MTTAYPVDLGGNNQIVSLPAILLDGLAHDNLGLAASVRFCTVEEVDASIVSGFHAIEGQLISHVAAVCDPASQRYHRDL